MAGLRRNRTYLGGKAAANGKSNVNLRRTAVEEAVLSKMKRRPCTGEGHRFGKIKTSLRHENRYLNPLNSAISRLSADSGKIEKLHKVPDQSASDEPGGNYDLREESNVESALWICGTCIQDPLKGEQ
ncbi:hypothetical protein E2C01_064418 [Portunus trituberculatus]|uniref:Uncharacterized protein n=1 Tax=Portunus trituberculatus TaxID=210409 RepID=A0A5B7HLR0_PORTR|nr:hypothetical protein [Portunus trituberculatus]